MNSQEMGFIRRAKRKIYWRRDPERRLRGGRRPVNHERRAAGRERSEVSPMANPERTGRFKAKTTHIRRKSKAQSLRRVAVIRHRPLMWTGSHAGETTDWFRISWLQPQMIDSRTMHC